MHAHLYTNAGTALAHQVRCQHGEVARARSSVQDSVASLQSQRLTVSLTDVSCCLTRVHQLPIVKPQCIRPSHVENGHGMMTRVEPQSQGA